jgi:hypothetical protein
MKNNLIFSLTVVAAVLIGCASHDDMLSVSNESRQIVDIILNENPDSLILTIRGNKKLAPTKGPQVDPKKLELFFPATSLNGVKGRFVPPDNDIIRSIIAHEHIENETINSTINIALKLGSTYAVTTDKDGLQITFAKNPTLPRKKIKPTQKPAKNKSQPGFTIPAEQQVPAATALKTVSTEVFENSIAVNVKADGTIRNYNAFTLVNPDRYVFDLYNVKSSHRDEQKIAVQSKWIKRIRYYGHPQKLRLVIETLNLADSKYSTDPSDTGLIIHVGAK